MEDDPTKSSADNLETMVEDRFGVLPNFFRLTPEAHQITDDLWGFTQSGYLDNPLPSLFKERLFVYLSQFCAARYCISRHVGFLVGQGRPAGDKDAKPESVQQVLQLLQRPLPSGKALDPHIDSCLQKIAPFTELPRPESAAEESLFACATHVFLEDGDAMRSLHALRQVLTGADLQYLLVFLAFVRTAHFWSSVHPELEHEADLVELFDANQALSERVLKGPMAVDSKAIQTLRDDLDDLLHQELDLKSRAGQALLLASIVESSDDAIISMRLDGTIQSWNASAERMFGHTEDEAVGRKISILIPPDRQREEEQIIARVAAGERVNQIDTERLNASGERIPVALSLSPIKNAQDEIVAASIIVRDISDKLQSAQALRVSEERLRSALEGAELGAWNLLDPNTMELQTDRRFREIFGDGSSDKLEFQDAVGMIHPDDQQRVTDAVLAAIRPIDPVPYEIEYRVVWPGQQPDEAVRWVFAKGSSRFEQTESGPQLISFDGTIMDITEQRELRERLHDAVERLSEADRRKDEFLATLAHELRNPLAPIRTGLDAMGLMEDDPTARERLRQIMVRQTNQIVHLVDDLLDVSRITQGKMRLRRGKVELLGTVRNAIEATKPLLEAAGHEFAVKLPDHPIMLEADQTRLSQILSNLLNNAVKYTKPPGHILLAVEAAKDEVVIRVQDDGVGIPENMHTAIFDMFGQAHRPKDNEQSGLGIGLTLVRTLVELHGGSIKVRSEGENKGSEFIVRLPRSNELAPNPLAVEPKVQQAVLRILVVDDNEGAADALSVLINLFGNDVRTAYSGEQAIEIASEFRPDVIFMDIGMPNMDGNEAARRIRKEPWGQDITLIALTGWGQKRDKLLTKDAGFDSHLVKPADSDAINAMLAELNAQR